MAFYKPYVTFFHLNTFVLLTFEHVDYTNLVFSI